MKSFVTTVFTTDGTQFNRKPNKINACHYCHLAYTAAKQKIKLLAPVVQRLYNAIHRINHYPADSVVCFVNTYPLDSDLSGG